MAKVTIHAQCILEGDATDVMRYLRDALEEIEQACQSYGTGEVRIVSVADVDFQNLDVREFLPQIPAT